MLQIAAVVIMGLTALFTLLGFLWAKGKIEGEVMTRLSIQDSDMKEIKAKLDLLSQNNDDSRRRTADDIGAVRERLAVIEFRLNSIDQQVSDIRRNLNR